MRSFLRTGTAAGEATLAEVLRRRQAEGACLIILAGETAIMDRYDIMPRAIEHAGHTDDAIAAEF